MGARLSRTATGNTPAAAIGLELGDMIVKAGWRADQEARGRSGPH